LVSLLLNGGYRFCPRVGFGHVLAARRPRWFPPPHPSGAVWPWPAPGCPGGASPGIAMVFPSLHCEPSDSPRYVLIVTLNPIDTLRFWTSPWVPYHLFNLCSGSKSPLELRAAPPCPAWQGTACFLGGLGTSGTPGHPHSHPASVCVIIFFIFIFVLLLSYYFCVYHAPPPHP